MSKDQNDEQKIDTTTQEQVQAAPSSTNDSTVYGQEPNSPNQLMLTPFEKGAVKLSQKSKGRCNVQ